MAHLPLRIILLPGVFLPPRLCGRAEPCLVREPAVQRGKAAVNEQDPLARPRCISLKRSDVCVIYK